MDKPGFKAYFAWITICIVWGTTYLAIRVGVENYPPMLFAGVRWIIAGSGFLLFLKLKKYTLPGFKDFLKLSIAGIAMIGVANGLVVVSAQWLPSGLIALLIATVPFWIVGLESLLPGKVRLNFTIVLGLMLGLAGIVLIFGDDFNFIFETGNLLGIILLMIAVFSWALGTIYTKYNKVEASPFVTAAIQMLVAGSLQTLLGISLGEFSQIHLEMNSTIAFFYLVIVGSVLGYGSYIYAIDKLPLSLVSTYAYINPVIALFLGWLILDEIITLQIIIAAVIIILGVTVVKQGASKFDKSSNPNGRIT